MRFLHRYKSYIFRLSIQLPFDVVIALVQTWYRGERKPRISSNFHIPPYSSCIKPGSLPPLIGKCAFCTDTKLTLLGSPFPQLPIDTIITLLQTRYRGERKPWISSNFHIPPYLSLHETGQFAAPYWEVRFLHRHKNYIFRLSIPSASFWYSYYLGANTVPWGKEAPNFLKFPYSALFVAA